MLTDSIPSSVYLMAFGSLSCVLLSFVWMIGLVFVHLRAYLRLKEKVKQQRIYRLQYEAFEYHSDVILSQFRRVKQGEELNIVSDLSSASSLCIDKAGKLIVVSSQR